MKWCGRRRAVLTTLGAAMVLAVAIPPPIAAAAARHGKAFAANRRISVEAFQTHLVGSVGRGSNARRQAAPSDDTFRHSPFLYCHRGRGDLAVRFVSTGDDNNLEGGDGRTSVTGTVYNVVDGDDPLAAGSQLYPVVQLYTKHGCTLCDKVSDVLRSVRDTYPHTLEAVDITDNDKGFWYEKYKYDIPVLHLDGMYWAKHRMTPEAAIGALKAATAGTFKEQPGDPDAGEMERRQAERSKNDESE